MPRHPRPLPSYSARCRRGHTVVLIDVWLVVLLLGAWALVPASTLDPLVALQGVAVLGMACVSYWVWALYFCEGDLFLPWPLMMLSAIVFHLGPLPGIVFSSPANWPPSLLQFSDSRLAETLLLAMVGLAMFHLGGVTGSRPRPSPTPKRSVSGVWSPRMVTLVASMLLGVGVAATLTAGVASFRVFAQGGYAEAVSTSARGISSIMDGMGAVQDLIVVGGLLLLLSNDRPRSALNIAAICSMAGLAVLRLGSGDRSGAVLPIIALLWVLSRTGRLTVSGPALVALGLGFFAISPIISTVRAVPLAQAPAAVTDMIAEMSVPDLFRSAGDEYGSSVATVAHTGDLVPNTRAYGYGAGYVEAILYVIPNRLRPMTIWPDGPPAEWLTWEVAPTIAGRGGGLGYSFIAEAYLEGGVPGIIIMLGLMGYAMGLVHRWALTRQHVMWTFLAAIVLAFGLRLPRGFVGELTRPLFWYWAVPLLVVFVSGLLIRRRVRSSPVGPTIAPQSHAPYVSSSSRRRVV